MRLFEMHKCAYTHTRARAEIGKEEKEREKERGERGETGKIEGFS